jgi:hypothetical protein
VAFGASIDTSANGTCGFIRGWRIISAYELSAVNDTVLRLRLPQTTKKSYIHQRLSTDAKKYTDIGMLQKEGWSSSMHPHVNKVSCSACQLLFETTYLATLVSWPLGCQDAIHEASVSDFTCRL